MDPGYLRHLEQHSDAAPSRAALLKLAAALETTLSALTGGDAELPPDPDRPGMILDSPS